jgi:hypothetical protein
MTNARFGLCPSLLLLAIACVTPSAASADDKASYDALVREGLQLSESGNWAEAYASFKRANEVRPGPRPLRGMAIVLFELRRYTEAIDCAERALAGVDAERPLSPAMRAELSSLRDKALTYVVRARLSVEPEDALVHVDGTPRTERELRLDEGDYTVEVSREGYVARTLTLRARIGQTPELTIKLDPVRAASPSGSSAPVYAIAPASEPSHLASWTLIGVGGAALVAGTITGIAASSTFSDLDEQCPGPSCTPELRDDTDTGRTLETLTNVLLISGGTFIVAGIVTRFVLERQETPEAVALSFAPSCGPTGCGIAVRGRL